VVVVVRLRGVVMLPLAVEATELFAALVLRMGVEMTEDDAASVRDSK